MSNTDDPSPRPSDGGPRLARRGFLLAATAAVITAGTLRISERPQSDDIPPDEVERRKAAFKALPPVKADYVQPGDYAEAYRTLSLSTPEMEQLQAAVAAGNLRLIWLAVFDSDAEDGDCVAIESLGLTQTVRLTKKPYRLALPMAPSGEIHFTGTDEGLGGGVTLGVIVGGRTIVFPPIQVGHTDILVLASS